MAVSTEIYVFLSSVGSHHQQFAYWQRKSVEARRRRQEKMHGFGTGCGISHIIADEIRNHGSFNTLPFSLGFFFKKKKKKVKTVVLLDRDNVGERAKTVGSFDFIS